MPKRLYLAPKNDPTAFARSAHHRAMVGNGPITPPGEQPQPPIIVDFWGGVARDVDDQVAQRLIDAGVASTQRPNIAVED